MKTVIMQPNYMPWIGYMNLMKQADVFVVYDDVQYTKNDWRNRNKIKTPNGSMWLTIPICKLKGTMIKDARVNDRFNWRDLHLKALRMNYARSTYFDEIYLIIETVLKSHLEHLYLINMEIISQLCKYLEIKTRIEYSSGIGFNKLKKTDRLVEICKKLKTTEYLSPNKSAEYIEPEKFEAAGINLLWHNYQHPKYQQLWGKFVEYLSVVDLLFNHGKKSRELI